MSHQETKVRSVLLLNKRSMPAAGFFYTVSSEKGLSADPLVRVRSGYFICGAFGLMLKGEHNGTVAIV